MIERAHNHSSRRRTQKKITGYLDAINKVYLRNRTRFYDPFIILPFLLILGFGYQLKNHC